MARSSHEPLAPRTVISTDIDAHFVAVESLIRRAVDHDEHVEVYMASPVPGSAETDAWLFKLTCVPWLADGRAQFLAAYSVRVRLDDPDDCQGESREEYDDSREIIKIDPDLPNLTAALATWLLRSGWLCSIERFGDTKFRACEAVDCEFTIVERGFQVSRRICPEGRMPGSDQVC